MADSESRIEPPRPAGRTISSVLGLIAFYAGSALRYVLAAVVLFLAVHLMYVLLQGLRAPAGEQRIRLDPVAPVVSGDTVALSGRYQPRSLIQIQVNERLEDVAFVAEDGTFRTQAHVARQVNLIKLFPVRDGRILRDQSTEAVVHSIGDTLLAPEIKCVLEIPSGWLLMGSADARVLLDILDGQRKPVAGAYSDDRGVFGLAVSDQVYRRPADYTLRVASSYPGRAERTLPLSEALGGAPVDSISRSIVVDLTRQGRKVELAVEASARLPYVARLLAGDLDDWGFVVAVFGDLLLPPMARGQREVSIHDQDRVSIRFVAALKEGAEAAPVIGLAAQTSRRPGDWPLLTAKDSFSVAWDQQPPTWFSPVPNIIEGKRATWRGPGQGVKLGFSPELAAAQRPAQPETDQQERKEPLSVREILADVRFPVAAAMAAQAALALIPFVWILWLIRRHSWFLRFAPEAGDSAARSRLAAVCLMLGLVCVWYQVYQLFDVPAFRSSKLWRYTGQTPNDFPVWTCWLAVLATVPLVAGLIDRRADVWVEQLRFDGGGRIPFLRAWRWVTATALGAALIWMARAGRTEFPWTYLDLSPKTVSALESYARVFPPGSALAATAAFLAVYVFGGPGLALSLAGVAAAALAPGVAGALGWTGQVLSVRLLIAVLCLFLLSQWIVPAHVLWPRAVLGSRPWRRFVLVLAALLTCFVFASPKWGLWTAGAIEVWVVLWLSMYLWRAVERAPAGGHAFRGAPLLAAAGAIVVCYPAHEPNRYYYLTSGLFPLLFQIDRFLPFVPLVAIVAWLARRRESPEAALRQDLILGPVLLALYLVGAPARIFYVPVPLIAGFLLARFWLFRKPAGGAEAAAPDHLRAQRIRELMDWRWTTRMARAYRRAQDKKLEKGELTIEQHQKLLADFQKNAGEFPEAQPRAGTNARDLALASGPTGDSWSDARIAVRYGLPLALPWVALTIYQFVATRQELAFPIPHFAVEVLVSLARWLAVAFVFGYFYRYLRGSSGLSKGVALSVAIVAPYLVLRLLLTEPLSEMKYFFYWAGQVFAFCTVLGVVAFDYETLRRNGYSWRHLTALHNVPALSAFGSSLAAALIPAVIAIFQGKVTDLMKFVVGSIWPKLPPATP